ncbi:unnamed protein product [Effrenium voratum]|nr:unnamed protein product [Effrenium voratum]
MRSAPRGFGWATAFAERRRQLQQLREEQFFHEPLSSVAVLVELRSVLEALCKNGDVAFDAVVSSTLQRALHTAELGMVPLKKDFAPLIALPKMAEIQCDDIWNEPRPREAVEESWPTWSLEGEPLHDFMCESSLDTCQSMIKRAEYVWRFLYNLPGSVIGVCGHGCFFYFLSRRIAAAESLRLPPFKEDIWQNGEVRRWILAAPEEQPMSWAEFGGLLHFSDFDFYNRYQRRVAVVNLARFSGAYYLPWLHKEWRWDRTDSDFDGELEELLNAGLKVRSNSLYDLLCSSRCCLTRSAGKF